MVTEPKHLRIKRIKGRARRVGLEVEEQGGGRYIFTNPVNREYTVCIGIKEAEDFSGGLIWGNLETRP